MGDGQEQDQYEERLKELFNSFDASGRGSLSHEELSDLCQSLHLDDATPALIHALLQDQDCLTDRVDFERFKNTLILFLSSTIESPQTAQETLPKPDSPVIRPKFVKGSKRYGRRSTPEFIEPVTNLFQVSSVNTEDEALEDNYDSAVPRKRERWNAHETTEEYEAEGQMQLWNPDETNTPRGSIIALSAQVEERLREACDELDVSWGGCAWHSQLIALCEHVGLEISGDVLLALDADTMTNVQEFVSMAINNNKPVTPSASTPYRQLKRLHSTQPFDDGGRRTTLSSTMGIQLFSTLDDGTGYTPVECVLDAWTEEGIENSTEVLQALNFDLDGKLSLSDLTMALESELLVTKNGIHQAALVSFKAEIRHLGECMEREIREKDKLRSDLEKAERLKTQLASEMDEHHSAIELSNNLHLRKLEQEHKDKLTAVRSELRTEMDLIQQQAGLQRDELEAELQKIRGEESFLREHLSISLKENRRLETELLDSTEKLVETQNQMSKLQTNLDNLTKDKYGDLDQGSADFFLQEERIKELRCSYEAQCRELQDRIDELQSELQDFHSLDRSHQSCNKPLSEELESKSPGMDSDPGLGSEDVRPFSMSLESEMMLEQLKEQHQQEVDECRNHLQTKIMEFDRALELQRATHQDQKASLILQHQQEIQALQQELVRMKSHSQELQAEELGGLRQQLLEAHTCTADLEEHLKNLESEQAEAEEMMVELRRKHLAEVQRLKDEYAEQLENRLLEERAELEQGLSGDWAREKKLLKESHEQQLEEVKMRSEVEHRDLVKSLTEQWQKEKTQLDEQNTEALQGLLEEEMLKMVFEQEEKEKELREQWEREHAQLQQQHQDEVLRRLEEERSQFEQRERRLRKQWDMERLQLEEDYEGMIQERVSEEKEKLQAEREEDEKMQQQSLKEEREHLEERQRVAVKELRAKHAEERATLSSTLEKLRDDIAVERSEVHRLADENAVLSQKIAALKNEDLKEEHDKLLKTLNHLKKEKFAAQKAAENGKKQISGLRLQNQKLENDNKVLSEENARISADVESLRQQLENRKREALPVEERTTLAACMSALEAELTKALEDSAQLEERNIQLSQQLSESREKAHLKDGMESQLSHLVEECRSVDKETMGLRNQLAKAQEKVNLADKTLQALNLHSSRLKSDLHALQQERDSLQQEVAVLNKQLQNANDKNRVLERALQHHSKTLYRDEMDHDLRQENKRLHAEVCSMRGDLVQCREKVCQLDATIVSLKQHKQQSSSSLMKALEQENVSLKQELQAQSKMNRGEAGSLSELQNLQQENEALKTRIEQLSTQLLETLQAQLLGLLPPSPHRLPRGQHRGEEPDVQSDRERKMKVMEGRMKEIELSLHNVKVLLKEKVVQLKEQLHKNSKSDVLLRDLYVDNTQLLRALELAEQRQNIAEKKNYLLEEKISSLNKIVRELSPSPLSSLPYLYKCP
ncbi:ninein isoform X2 [Gouania willdenowi]|uniref:ninein isoform X2 n=1 Tax=Gouania willdenowi TaxID=441366 RepID=UPI0010548AC8|nr:ninein isoform X2 [Gouania willdenowi]